MLQKSHPTEWHTNNTCMNNRQNEATTHSVALQQHFFELKTELEDFNSIFTGWVSGKRGLLTTDKEVYLKTLAEEQDLVEGLKKQLASLVNKRQNVVAELQAEQREYEEAVNYNRELELQLKTLTKRLVEMSGEAGRLRDQLSIEETGRANREADLLIRYLALERKEELVRNSVLREKLNIYQCQEKLGLYVERIEDNVTKFSFKYIDPANWERHFCITIDVSTSRYRIRACEPMLPQLSALLDQLNTDGDFYNFLCKVRTNFVELEKKK